MEVTIKLSCLEELFVSEYISNGFNGTQAYLKVRPDVKEESAAVSSARWLDKVTVKNAIDARLDMRKEEANGSIASKDYLTKEAHEIGKEAREDKSYGAALNAVDLKAKLNQVCKEDTEQGKYTNTMTNIFMQINQVNKKSEEAIDVTPEAVEDDEVKK